ncbi:unnamed protein product, partial [Aphanomyces euteiches]
MSRETINRLIAASTEESSNLHRGNLLFEHTVRKIEDVNPMDVPSAFDAAILESYVQTGSEALITLMNFTMTEFNILSGPCVRDAHESWYDGGGRENSASSKDASYLLLVVMDLVEPVGTQRLLSPITTEAQCHTGKLFGQFPGTLYTAN